MPWKLFFSSVQDYVIKLSTNVLNYSNYFGFQEKCIWYALIKILVYKYLFKLTICIYWLIKHFFYHLKQYFSHFRFVLFDSFIYYAYLGSKHLKKVSLIFTWSFLKRNGLKISIINDWYFRFCKYSLIPADLYLFYKSFFYLMD